MTRTLPTSWIHAYEATRPGTVVTKSATPASVEQRREVLTKQRAKRAKDAEEFLIRRLDGEARELFATVISFRRSIGALDTSKLATARLLLGPDRDLLVRQAKAFQAAEAASAEG